MNLASAGFEDRSSAHSADSRTSAMQHPAKAILSVLRVSENGVLGVGKLLHLCACVPSPLQKKTHVACSAGEKMSTELGSMATLDSLGKVSKGR